MSKTIEVATSLFGKDAVAKITYTARVDVNGRLDIIVEKITVNNERLQVPRAYLTQFIPQITKQVCAETWIDFAPEAQ